MHLVELVISGYRAAVVNFRSDCVSVRRIFSKISREGQEISDQSVPCGVQVKKKEEEGKNLLRIGSRQQRKETVQIFGMYAD